MGHGCLGVAAEVARETLLAQPGPFTSPTGPVIFPPAPLQACLDFYLKGYGVAHPGATALC
jgi:hypothetical protein